MLKIYKRLLLFLFLLIIKVSFGEINQDEKNKISVETEKLVQDGKILEAIDKFNEIIKKDSNDLEAKKILARLYKMSNDKEKEKKMYLELIEAGEKSVRNSLAELYYSEEKYNESLEIYLELYNENPVPELMYNIGILYENLRDYSKAEEWYTKAAKKKHLDAQYSLGLLYSSEKKYKEAAKWYDKPAKKGNPKAQNNLGYTYFRLRNNRKAKLWLERAIITAQELEDIDVIKASEEGLNEIENGVK